VGNYRLKGVNLEGKNGKIGQVGSWLWGLGRG
jgi:hypothetical protein